MTTRRGLALVALMALVGLTAGLIIGKDAAQTIGILASMALITTIAIFPDHI